MRSTVESAVPALKTSVHVNIKANTKMNKFLEHIKKIAIADSRLFLEPYVTVGRLIRRLFRTVFSRLKRSNTNDRKGDGQ